jgi:hypothetical protein
VVTEILEPKIDGQQALPYGGESGKTLGARGWYEDKDVLALMRKRSQGQAVHSDGFLSFAGMVEPAYECECGFNGIFSDVKCAKCGKAL